MTLPQDGCLLRIFIGEADRYDGQPLYEWLVQRARARGLAGATVVRGIMGFGANSRIHTFRIERLSLDLPIIVELVDTRAKLEAYLAEIDLAIADGLATLEKAEVRFYRSRPDASRGGTA
jgi:PII-like signaling protein